MVKKTENIAIIGTGNVGSHLAQALYNDGINIKQLFSRSINKVIAIAEKTDSSPIDNLDQLHDNLDLIIVAVNDDAIRSVIEQIPFRNVLTVHTSGSVSLNVFDSLGYNNFGIFYPLQSFNKHQEINIKEVPFCLEAVNNKSLFVLESLAKKISNHVYHINSKERETLHLAAVFANNYSNFMYQIAKQITDESNLSFDLLKPLINETANKINFLSPKEAQTGPAQRNDLKTIEKHLLLLQDSPNLKELYKNISELIINSSNQSN